ncbi:MAG: serine/threonine dehydratase [Actinobacteria bacterium]|nr:serine/threonine dehydratase [Actinomycetota bacterium]
MAATLPATATVPPRGSSSDGDELAVGEACVDGDTDRGDHRPYEVTRADVLAAAERIAPYVRRTPVLALERGAFGVPCRLVCKLELHQHAGSFKTRGAFNRLLTSDRAADAGVCAASGGNFGTAVAYAAGVLGIRATVFVPEISSPAKVARLRELGAEVVVTGREYADALDACRRRVEETGADMPHAYDDHAVVAGAGTLARELLDEEPDLDTIVVAVGGGGLLGGIASWVRGDVRVVAVESTGTPTLARAVAAGEPVDVEVGGLVADSLGARRIGDHGFAAASRWVDTRVQLHDDRIREAQRRLWRDARIACEPAAAAPLAALGPERYVPEADECVALVVCGGNVDLATLARP